jgi:hypothetical protein
VSKSTNMFSQKVSQPVCVLWIQRPACVIHVLMFQLLAEFTQFEMGFAIYRCKYVCVFWISNPMFNPVYKHRLRKSGLGFDFWVLQTQNRFKNVYIFKKTRPKKYKLHFRFYLKKRKRYCTVNKTLLKSSNKHFLDQFQVINYLNQANFTWIKQWFVDIINICLIQVIDYLKSKKFILLDFIKVLFSVWEGKFFFSTTAIFHLSIKWVIWLQSELITI